MMQDDLPPLPPQHPGGFIWEPHAGRMRIVTDAEWGALADDLLPAVREAAAALANPLIRGANIHPMIVERAARLTELLAGDMPEVAARSPRVYMASLWLAEKYDTDRKLRGANDPMGEPLSDEMRAALVDLMAVLPSFVRQFPKVLEIEADREEFFADALHLDAAERAAMGAEEARLIAPEDAQPLSEGVAAARGEGPLADRAGRSVVRSLRNLASAGFVAGAVFGHVTGFVSGEVLGGIADGVGIEIRAPMGRWVRGRHEDIQTLFATAPPDLRIAIAQHVEALMDPGPIPAPPVPPVQKGRTWIVDPEPGRGDFTMIQPAIDASADGDTVVVREGEYRGSLRLSKSITLQGEGEPETVVVLADDNDALFCDAPKARVIGLHFLQRDESRGVMAQALYIAGGASGFEHCIFESRAASGVLVLGENAGPQFHLCVMRKCRSYGLLVMGGALVRLEQCKALGNGDAGIWVQDDGSRVEATGCVAEGNARYGCFVGIGSEVRLDTCTVAENGLDGICVAGGPASMMGTIARNNTHSGVWVYSEGNCEVDRCQITGNGWYGLKINGASTVNVSDSAITGNSQAAIRFDDATSTGTFRNNDLRGNADGPWDIAKGATIIDENNLT